MYSLLTKYIAKRADYHVTDETTTGVFSLHFSGESPAESPNTVTRKKRASKWFATLKKKTKLKDPREEKEEEASELPGDSTGQRRNSLPHDSNSLEAEDITPLSARQSNRLRSSQYSHSETSAQQRREFRRSASVANNRARALIRSASKADK